MIDIEPRTYGTRCLRRTKTALVHNKTGTFARLAHRPRKLERTVRYLAVEAEDRPFFPEPTDPRRRAGGPEAVAGNFGSGM